MIKIKVSAQLLCMTSAKQSIISNYEAIETD